MSSFLDSVGYFLAAMLIAAYPAAILYWLLIHPFARFWRRRGPLVTYLVVSVVCLALVYWILTWRETLLAERWPFSWPLAVAGVVLYAVAIWLEIQCRRYLKFRILAGAPEIGSDPGKVLDQGIYGRLRHPRYLSVILGTLGWALVLNYPALWVVTVAMIPGLYLVILFEERELRQRFGADYEAYMRAVPRRLVPRF